MSSAAFYEIIGLLLSPFRARSSDLVVVVGSGGSGDGIGGVAAVVIEAVVIVVVGSGGVVDELQGIVALRHGRC